MVKERKAGVLSARAGVMSTNVDFAIVDEEDSRLILASVFERGTALRSFTATAQGTTMFINGTSNGRTIHRAVRFVQTENLFSVMNSGAEQVSHAVMKYKPAKEDVVYVYATKDNWEDSFYDYLMNTHDLPLLKEWSSAILAEAEREKVVSRPCELYCSEGCTATMPLYGKDTKIEDIIILKISITSGWLDETVTRLLSQKSVCICEEEMQPLSALTKENANVDTYFGEYGNTVKDNLVKFMSPVSEFTPVVEHIALKAKKPFPQQANAIAGAAKQLMDMPYVIFNMGMGCGKTFCSIATEETYHVTKWLRRNPGKTLRDCYMDPHAINYRVIVTCPGHLVEKWKSEIEEVIPYAKVKILRKFEDVTAIKKRGYKRNGREFYIMSKDFMKLESTYRPVPWKVAEKDLPAWECCDCGNSVKGINIVPITSYKCECGGRKFKRVKTDNIQKGLLCPDCGEVLINSADAALFPTDFSSKKTENYKCRHCGSKLWTHDVSNLDGKEIVKKQGAWRLVSHFANKRKKSRTTSWVLKGHENTLFAAKGLNITEIEDANPRKIRKVAPADYIHRQMKGYFDCCILDELHKFKGGGTAQGIAMHALIKSSKHTIGLTGTIAGGYSEDLFYLLYRLDPRRMKSNGFEYHKISAFSDVYGTREATFEVGENSSMNKSSRGRQLSAKKTKPGISPLIFGDFLIDRCIFMDITDMGKYIPELKEEIVLCPTNSAVMSEYSHVLSTLKRAGGNGLNPLSSITLQFSMSYLDKPYGQSMIIHPKTGQKVIQPGDYNLSAGEYLPKEEKLIELINKEQSEGRNVFVYCEYTSSESTKVTERVKKIIEDGCNLRGKVAILESTKPQPSEREAWLKKQAVEGKRVIISNPQCVETGLDFIFKKNGITYTYPTLIFYQMGYNLFTLWQASRRHYRLNQTKECRTYYLAYEGTVQQTILSTMAEKQVATSAIQGGKFSAEGLSAMANGVDARLKLIQALNNEKGVDVNAGQELQKQFNSMNERKEDYEEYDTSNAVDFYELTGLTQCSTFESKSLGNGSIFDILQNPMPVIDTTAKEISFEKVEPEPDTTDTGKAIPEDNKTAATNKINLSEEPKTKSSSKETGKGQKKESTKQQQKGFKVTATVLGTIKKEKKQKKGIHEAQMSLFDLFG